MFSSPLQRAIKRGLAPGGDLSHEIQNLNNYQLSSRKDARAVCAALEHIARLLPSDAALSSIHALAALFQNAEGPDCPAFPILREEGIHLLLQIYDKLLATESADDRKNDLLFILKILALYGTPEGAERVISTARMPFHPGDYLWSVILGCFCDGHPERDAVFSALSNPLPPDFIAIALLDAANSECVAGQPRSKRPSAAPSRQNHSRRSHHRPNGPPPAPGSKKFSPADHAPHAASSPKARSTASKSARSNVRFTNWAAALPSKASSPAGGGR